MEWTVQDTQAVIISVGLIVSGLTFWRTLVIEHMLGQYIKRTENLERVIVGKGKAK